MRRAPVIADPVVAARGRGDDRARHLAAPARRRGRRSCSPTMRRRRRCRRSISIRCSTRRATAAASVLPPRADHLRRRRRRRRTSHAGRNLADAAGLGLYRPLPAGRRRAGRADAGSIRAGRSGPTRPRAPVARTASSPAGSASVGEDGPIILAAATAPPPLVPSQRAAAIDAIPNNHLSYAVPMVLLRGQRAGHLRAGAAAPEAARHSCRPDALSA